MHRLYAPPLRIHFLHSYTQHAVLLACAQTCIHRSHAQPLHVYYLHSHYQHPPAKKAHIVFEKLDSIRLDLFVLYASSRNLFGAVKCLMDHGLGFRMKVLLPLLKFVIE